MWGASANPVCPNIGWDGENPDPDAVPLCWYVPTDCESMKNVTFMNVGVELP